MEHKTGLEDYYVIRGQKKMRFGYTTGSCAAAACKGACLMLLGKEKLTSVPLMTPKGILLDLELHDIQISENQVTCAVKKAAGDDPDTTNGILVYATVWKTDTAGIVIDGGVGVGRVTRPGLSQKVGEAAINSVPRAMILREAEEAAVSHDYEGGLKVVISVPEGLDLGNHPIIKKKKIDRLIAYADGTLPRDYVPDISHKRIHIAAGDCEGCGACIRRCPNKAIHWNQYGLAAVDDDVCLTCGYCAPVCPVRAIILF